MNAKVETRNHNIYSSRTFLSTDETKYGFVATKIEVVECAKGKAFLKDCEIVVRADHGSQVHIHLTSAPGGYLRKVKKLLKCLDTAINAFAEFNALPKEVEKKPKTSNGVCANRGYQVFLNPLDGMASGTVKTNVICWYDETKDGLFELKVEGTFDLADCTRKLKMIMNNDAELVVIRDAILAHHDKLVSLSKTVLGRKFVLETK